MRRKSGRKSAPARLYRDGPLSIRPPEEIAYGTGRCTLGPILVATSDKGIVTYMVRPKPAQLLLHLGPRLPTATLTRHEKGGNGLVPRSIP